MERKYIDQSNLVSNTGTTVLIKEARVLPDNDVMIGYQTVCDYKDLNDDNPYITYRKLSEIQLAYNPLAEKEIGENR